MAPCIEHLPAELLGKVLAPLPLADRISLASTCRRIWGCATPYVFESVTFSIDGAIDNTARSALLAVQKYRDCVKELTVVVPPPTCAYADCYFCDDDHDKGAAEVAAETAGTWLGPDATTLLGGGHVLLPELRRLVVRLPSVFGTHEGVYFDMALDEEPTDGDLARRNSVRAAAIFEALAASQRPGSEAAFRGLVVLNFPPPLDDSRLVFSSDPWRRFLGGLTDLDITLLGERSDMMQSNSQRSYRAFLQQLDDALFKHLGALKWLRLEASEWGPIGAIDTCSTDEDEDEDDGLPFSLPDSPALAQLQLVNVMVGKRLARFLQSGLRRGPYALSLFGARAHGAHDTFADFFEALTDAEVPIRSFKIAPTDAALFDDRPLPRVYPPLSEEQIAAARKKRSANPGLPLFDYAFLDEKYMCWVYDGAQIIFAFNKGRDQEAYSRFMARVDGLDRNASADSADGKVASRS